MRYTLHRNFVLASTLGHSIEFKKGVPVEVPLIMHHEVIGIGAVPEGDWPEDEVKPAEPVDQNKRQEDITAAIELIVQKADREDFTAAGTPHPRAVSKIVGYNVSAKERDTAWNDFLNKEHEE